jgi:hypothetical protein
MLAFVFRIVALVRKDLLAMFKDPRERGVLFVPPLLQCLLFGYVATFDLNRVYYAAFEIAAPPHLSCWLPWTDRTSFVASQTPKASTN